MPSLEGEEALRKVCLEWALRIAPAAPAWSEESEPPDERKSGDDYRLENIIEAARQFYAFVKGLPPGRGGNGRASD